MSYSIMDLEARIAEIDGRIAQLELVMATTTVLGETRRCSHEISQLIAERLHMRDLIKRKKSSNSSMKNAVIAGAVIGAAIGILYAFNR